MSPASVFEHAVEIAPEFGPVLEEHLRDNSELLPHVLMPSLLTFIGGRLTEQDQSVDPKVVALLELLELEVAGDNSDTQNLIAVSFLENMEAEPFFEQLFPLLGPKLRAAHTPLAWRKNKSAKEARDAG
jgi:hypothetical protein